MEDGNVRPFEQESKLRELITKAHANGVKVMISVGGWSYKNAELSIQAFFLELSVSPRACLSALQEQT